MRTPAPGSLLGRIALTLVGVGLIATAVQGTFSYVDARRALRHEVLDRLASIQENKRRAIVASLSDAITRAQMLASDPEVTRAVEQLRAYHVSVAESEDAPFDTGTEAYRTIAGAERRTFQNRAGAQGFDNLLLVCARHGHVMFSTADGPELGTNVGSGPQRKSALARVWRRVIDNGRPAVEDYAVAAEGSEPVLYIGAPVFDATHLVVAVVVGELSTEMIGGLLQQEAGLGATGKVLLVGEDRRLRTEPPRAGDAPPDGRYDVEQIRLAFGGRPGGGVYTGPGGEEVVASFGLVDLKRLGLDFDWVIDVEQDTSEAFESMDGMARTDLVVAAGALLLSSLVGGILVRTLAGEVSRMVRVADAIAGGDLESPVAPSSQGELGRLAGALRRVQASLRAGRERDAQAAAELRKAAAHTRSLIEASLDMLVTTGPDGKVSDVNRAAIEAFGVSREAMLGSELANYFTEPARARLGHQRVLAEGILRNFALDLRRADGGVTPVLYNASVYRDEAGAVAGVFKVMRDVSEARASEWLKAGLAQLNDVMRGEDDAHRLAQKIIAELCSYLGASVGVLYLAEEVQDADVLTLAGTYAYAEPTTIPDQLRLGQGLVGQVALDRKQIVIGDAPGAYLQIESGLGSTPPHQICITPFTFEEELGGVVEVGTLTELDAVRLDYLSRAARSIGVAFGTAQGRVRLARELVRSRALTTELQSQQEELRVSNEELEEKNALLERRQREVEAARAEMTAKAAELAVTSRYKSEFLANMSHELRTPLNSLLLLARGLMDNRAGRLGPGEIESARVIHASGNDLLALINEILDLSKIEAGRMELALADAPVQEIVDAVNDGFAHMARAQAVSFEVQIEAGLPTAIRTDRRRLHQVLKNLISNALKFTERGSVTVRFHRPAPGTNLARSRLQVDQALAVSVVDTGIGIAPADMELVFEAFRQVDSGTARSYGGTGLGLSISRELARLLGGEIQLDSTLGVGSTFTLYVPLRTEAVAPGPTTRPQPLQARAPSIAPRPAPAVPDDRAALTPSDHAILVIEDDVLQARVLLRHCHDRGHTCLVATTGEEGLALARLHPLRAVILDLTLPGMDGWEVLQSMKRDTRLRHVPVHIVSADGPTIQSFRRGAVGHLRKPLSTGDLDKLLVTLEAANERTARSILLVEEDEPMRRHLVDLLAAGDVRVDAVSSGDAALRAIRADRHDCLVLHPGLLDPPGTDLLGTLSQDPDVHLPPVVVRTPRDLTREQEVRLRGYSESIVLKTVRSEERLLDEVSLFLHRAVSGMPPRQQRVITDLHDSGAMFVDKTVLVVDDDMRSAFAITRILGEHGLKTQKAENGEKALKILDSGQPVDLNRIAAQRSGSRPSLSEIDSRASSLDRRISTFETR